MRFLTSRPFCLVSCISHNLLCAAARTLHSPQPGAYHRTESTGDSLSRRGAGIEGMAYVQHGKEPDMRAMVTPKFGGPELFEERDDAERPAPDPGQVLVRVLAAGVNPIDTKLRTDGS